MELGSKTRKASGLRPTSIGETLTSKLTMPSRCFWTRFAIVAVTWNAFQHFYPYLDVVTVDWHEELRRALRAAATDADVPAFERTLGFLVARAQDGHGNVYPGPPGPRLQLPFQVTFVGEDLVVTRPFPAAGSGVRAGDVVVSIGGRAVADIYAEKAAVTSSATEGWLRHKAGHLVLIGEEAGPVPVVLRAPDGTEREVELTRVSEPMRTREPRPPSGSELAPGIVYFDLDGAATEELAHHLDALAAAEGIVFDLRGYPGSAGADLLPHLSDETLHSAWWNIPVYTRPDQVAAEYQRSHWTLEPTEPRLRGHVAFLTDGSAISYAESCMGIVEHYRLGEIVGARTAGTNGNINRLPLPGGWRVIWTGMKVTKHDDSRHHGVGILPTVPVSRTIEGIAAGRDEVLDAAVRTLREKIEG